jgi:hypothetical protein
MGGSPATIALERHQGDVVLNEAAIRDFSPSRCFSSLRASLTLRISTTRGSDAVAPELDSPDGAVHEERERGRPSSIVREECALSQSSLTVAADRHSA